jgi:exonuclease III
VPVEEPSTASEADIIGCYRFLFNSGFATSRALPKARFFQSCMAKAAKSDQMLFLLLGDLNTGCNDLDVEGNGAPFYCADLFRALEGQSGLTDLWRAEHGMQREWTWRSRRNGFRIDHAFGNKRFLDRYPSIACSYDHRPREIGITDHSARLLRYA